MQTNHSNGSTPICLVLDWLPQSENQIRSQHWTKNHKAKQAAKAALNSALASSPAALDLWTQTTTLEAVKDFETSSRTLSARRMPIKVEWEYGQVKSDSKTTIVIIERL